jgi:hypothetical protein
VLLPLSSVQLFSLAHVECILLKKKLHRCFCWLLTHSMVKNKSWLSLSLSTNIRLSLWNPKVHHRVHKNPPRDPFLSQVLFPLLRSCQRISPGPRRFETFRNKLHFYGEGLLAPRPTPKLECHPLPALRDCLFNIFAAILRIWRPSLHLQSEDAPCLGVKGPT